MYSSHCGGVVSKSGLKEVRERINVTEAKGGVERRTEREKDRSEF